MGRIFLFGLALLALSSSRGAPVIATVVNGTAHQALFAVAFDGKSGVAVGAAGQILLTSDGGDRWQASRQSGSTTLSLLGIDVRGEERIAVGQAGLILVSRGGDEWRRFEDATKERLFAVSLNGHGKAVAVGAFGTVVESLDHGKSWRSIAPANPSQYSDQGADPHFYAVSVGDGGLVTVAGEFGLVLRSADDGASWSVAHKGIASLFGLELRTDGSSYAVGQAGTILRSADGGATWTEVVSNSQANLLGVSAGANGVVIVTAMNSVLTSSNGGAAWAPVAWGDFGSSWYAGVRFVDPSLTTAVLVGHAGRILRVNP